MDNTKTEVPSVAFPAQCSFPVRDGNLIKPHVDPGPFYERLVQCMENAQHRIWMAVSFFSLRFIVTSPSHPKHPQNLFEFLQDIKTQKPSLDIRILFWNNPQFSLGATTVFSGVPQHFEYLNKLVSQSNNSNSSPVAIRWDASPNKHHCHHEKSWIIDAFTDSSVAFVGGIVLTGALDYPTHQPLFDQKGKKIYQRHDITSEIQGPTCYDVACHFSQRWNEANGHKEPQGHYPNLDIANDISLQHHIPVPKGNSRVQLQRTVRGGAYFTKLNIHPTEDKNSIISDHFEISQGEASIYYQYQAAIKSAKRTLYIENQHIAHGPLLDLIMEALQRGVLVFYLVPAQGMGAAVAVWRQTSQWKHSIEHGKIPKDTRMKFRGNLTHFSTAPPAYSDIFLKYLPELQKYPNFCLAGLAVKDHNQDIEFVYVHAKLLIVDEEWFTLGSANLVDISFEKDHTELNIAVWDPSVARGLFNQLIQEHTGKDASNLSGTDAIKMIHQVAAENRKKIVAIQQGNNPSEIQWSGNVFQLRPDRYCSDKF